MYDERFFGIKIPLSQGCREVLSKYPHFFNIIGFDQIQRLRVFKPPDHEFGDNKFLRCVCEGLHVDLREISIYSFNLEITYVVAVKSHEVGFEH